MATGTGTLSLFVIFISEFNVSDIYAVGWEASRDWMAGISGVLIMLAIWYAQWKRRLIFFLEVNPVISK